MCEGRGSACAKRKVRGRECGELGVIIGPMQASLGMRPEVGVQVSVVFYHSKLTHHHSSVSQQG